MRGSLYLALPLGAALFAVLLAYAGAAQVAAAVAAAGWGLAWVSLFHLPVLGLDALGWWWLGATRRLPFAWVALARWISESVNDLLPVAQIGGNVVRARLAAGRRLSGPEAGAAVVVDLTLIALAQFLYTLLGLGLLLGRLGRAQTAEVAASVAAGGLAVAAFYAAQRRGLFVLLARLVERAAAGRAWFGLVGGAVALDARVVALYRERRRLLTSGAAHLGAWLLGTGEVWLALRFLGHPLG
ncbi:MAG: TIGR00374 family protein, partial [Nitrospirae bacterium]